MLKNSRLFCDIRARVLDSRYGKVYRKEARALLIDLKRKKTLKEGESFGGKCWEKIIARRESVLISNGWTKVAGPVLHFLKYKGINVVVGRRLNNHDAYWCRVPKNIRKSFPK